MEERQTLSGHLAPPVLMGFEEVLTSTARTGRQSAHYVVCICN
jgi:hypothetical protein